MKKLGSIFVVLLTLIFLNACNRFSAPKSENYNTSKSALSNLNILNQATSMVEKAEKMKSDIDSKIASEEQAALDKENNISMDLNSIKSGSLSSIKGIWKNANGNTIEVSDSTISMGQSGLVYHANSEEHHASINGTSYGFATGDIKNGSYSIASDSSSFASYLIFIPKGVSFGDMQPVSMSMGENSTNQGNITYTQSKGDISDLTKDRMFFSPLAKFGVGPIATEITADNVNLVYYREPVTNLPNLPMSNSDKSSLDNVVKEAQVLIDKLSSGTDKTYLQSRIGRVVKSTQSLAMNVNQLAEMDFSSVQGTWENKDGDKIVINGQDIQISKNNDGFIESDEFTIGGPGQINGGSFKYGDSNSSGVTNGQYYIFAGKFGPDDLLYFTPRGVDDTQYVTESTGDISNSQQISGDNSRDRISWPNHVGPLTGLYDHDFYRVTE